MGGSGRAFRRRDTVRSTALTKPVALRLPARRARSTASSTTADAGTRVRCSNWYVLRPQDLDDLRVEAADRPLRELADDAVERGPPALDARRDFRGQRAIAVIGERGSGARNCGGQVSPAGRDREEDVVGGEARRRDHGAAGQAAGQPAPDGRQENPASASASFLRPGARRSGGHPRRWPHAGRRPARPRSSRAARRSTAIGEMRPQEDQSLAVAETSRHAATDAGRGSGCAVRSAGRDQSIGTVVLREALARRSPRPRSGAPRRRRPAASRSTASVSSLAPSCARSCSTSTLVSSSPIGRVARPRASGRRRAP